MRRVVITGTGVISPFGRGVGRLMEALYSGKNGTATLPELAEIGGLRTRVAAPVPEMDPKEIPRKFRRSMSKMSIYATLACQEAIGQASITPDICASGQLGISLGSTVGSPIATSDFYKEFIHRKSLETTRATFFFQIMNHSCATNVAQVFGITGRILAPSAACSTGCQAIGYGYEMIAHGKQDMVLCGGADEFHPLAAAIFDIINASSIKYNDEPAKTPRPFDRERDGVVCSEGSGILLLESLESAKSRNVPILAEIAGFATVSDPTNIADPNIESIEACIRKTLSDANINPGDVSYINAHATGTIQGDIAESDAIAAIFGKDIPVSSLKGHLGHTMAASGAIETIAAIHMMRKKILIPTLNLDNVDPLCENIALLKDFYETTVDIVLKNNFALGGVNSCIVLKKYEND